MFTDIKQRFLATMKASGEASEADIKALENNIRRDEMTKEERIEVERADLQRKLFDSMRSDSGVDQDYVNKCEVTHLGGELEDGTRVVKTTREGGRGIRPGLYFMHPYFMQRLKAEGGKPTLMFCYQDENGKGCKPNRTGIMRLKEFVDSSSYKQTSWVPKARAEDLATNGFVRTKEAKRLLVFGLIAEYENVDEAMMDCSSSDYKPVMFDRSVINRRMVVALFDLDTGKRIESFRVDTNQTCGGFNDIIDTIRFEKDEHGREVLKEIRVTMPMIQTRY